MTQEEFKSLCDLLDEIYVRQADCNEKQNSVSTRFANDDVRLKLFEQKMKSWEWMFKLITTGVIGTLVTSILTLVFK